MNITVHADNRQTISAQKTYSAIGKFTAIYAEKGPQLSLDEAQEAVSVYSPHLDKHPQLL